MKINYLLCCLFFLTALIHPVAKTQHLLENPALDEKVKTFLNNSKGKWKDLNIPEVDGKLLFELIVENNLKSALEIGTSTGYSGIWIAWALSKTGGKLITIEIDEVRQKKALENFKEAGLSDYIDARLADAHKLVYELPGSFDFVFSDADKNWYKNYFMAVDPKLVKGGIYTSHNVFSRDRTGSGNMAAYVNYLLSLPNYTTTFNDTGNGVAISKKISK